MCEYIEQLVNKWVNHIYRYSNLVTFYFLIYPNNRSTFSYTQRIVLLSDIPKQSFYFLIYPNNRSTFWFTQTIVLFSDLPKQSFDTTNVFNVIIFVLLSDLPKQWFDTTNVFNVILYVRACVTVYTNTCILKTLCCKCINMS